MCEGDGAEECPVLGFPCVSLSTSPCVYFSNCFKRAGLLVTHDPVCLKLALSVSSPFPSPRLSSFMVWGQTRQ